MLAIHERAAGAGRGAPRLGQRAMQLLEAGEAGAAGGAVHIEHHEVGGAHTEIEVGLAGCEYHASNNARVRARVFQAVWDKPRADACRGWRNRRRHRCTQRRVGVLALTTPNRGSTAWPIVGEGQRVRQNSVVHGRFRPGRTVRCSPASSFSEPPLRFFFAGVCILSGRSSPMSSAIGRSAKRMP